MNMATMTNRPIAPTRDGHISLTRGVPPLESLPVAALVSHAADVLKDAAAVAFQYAPLGGHLGDHALREQLGLFHGVEPDSIFVGNGSLQVLDLLTTLLVSDQRVTRVYVEAPTYDRALTLFARHKLEIIGIPLHSDGLDIDQLSTYLCASTPAFIYTIPDFQNPSGITMSTEKRSALVRLALTHGVTIIEDIPYRELRYNGTKAPSLAELASGATVLTIGSLTKILSPGLRIGYAITDPPLARSLARLAEDTYLSPSPLCQLVAARCFRNGVVHDNIIHVCELLRPRHDAAVASINRLIPGALISIPDGGYFLGILLTTEVAESRFIGAAREAGVLLTVGSSFYPKPLSAPKRTLFIRLPFQGLAAEDFASAIETIVAISKDQ